MTKQVLTVCLAALLGGCGGVFSKAPASDDATSRHDDRLIGFWRVDDAAPSGEKHADPAREESILAIGRKKGSTNFFELATVTLRHDETLEVSRGEFPATTIDRKDYVSLREALLAVPEKSEPLWTVCRYEMPDADTLRVFVMDEKAAAGDVRAGKIAGTVEESKGPLNSEPNLTVTLSASTAALRDWLAQRGDGVFQSDRSLVLRRVRTR